jgi:PD-(D/E)XK nuclease superfamily
MKFSYSQFSLFQKCSRYWKNSYRLKLSKPEIGASLVFGSAIDKAVSSLLDNKPDWKEVFTKTMAEIVLDGKFIKVFDNPNIVYANGDMDIYVLQDKDIILMDSWVKELNLSTYGTTAVEIFKECVKIKKNPYKKTTPEMMKYFSRGSWLSLIRKGEILLDAFKEQILPQITEVISLQKHANIKDELSGDSVVGVIDMVVKLKQYGNSPVILDLKTSAFPYLEEQLETSPQLTLYAALESKNVAFPIHVGYVVLCKNIPKESIATCSLCGHTQDSKHRTCNQIINEKRCNGSWIEKKLLKPTIQLIVQTKDQQQVNDLLQDFTNVIVTAKNDLTFRNNETCNNFFGQKCIYYNLCWKSDSTGLIKKGN